MVYKQHNFTEGEYINKQALTEAVQPNVHEKGENKS